MQAQFTGPNDSSFRLHVGLDDFILSGQMALLSKVNLCSPEELLLDQIPENIDWDNDEEVEAAFGQACEALMEAAVLQVSLDKQDLLFVREELIPNLRFWPVEVEPSVA